MLFIMGLNKVSIFLLFSDKIFVTLYFDKSNEQKGGRHNEQTQDEFQESWN